MSKAERESPTKAVVRRLKGVVFELVRQEASRALNHFREAWQQSRDSGRRAQTPNAAEGRPATAAEPDRRPDAVETKPTARAESKTREMQAAEKASRRSGHAGAKTRVAAKAHPSHAAVKGPKPSSPKAASLHQKTTGAGAGHVDLNKASREELMGLVGIGQSRAEAIIAGRPYADPQDLVTRRILPQAVLDGLKDQVTA